MGTDEEHSVQRTMSVSNAELANGDDEACLGRLTLAVNAATHTDGRTSQTWL